MHEGVTRLCGEAARAASQVICIFSNGIGDGLLALPAARALRDKFGHRFQLLTDSPIFLEIFAAEFAGQVTRISVTRDAVSGTFIDDVQWADWSLSNSIVIWMNAWYDHRTVQALAGRSMLAIGHFPGFQIEIPYREDIHCADNLANLLAPLDIHMIRERFWHSGNFAGDAARFVAASGKIVALHLETATEKLLPKDVEQRIVAKMAAGRPDLTFLSLYRDTPPAFAAWPANVHPICGAPLAMAFDIIQRSSAFVGYDSCMLHFADLARTPACALFVSTNPEEFGLYAGPGTHVLCRQIEEAELVARLDSFLSAYLKQDSRGYI